IEEGFRQAVASGGQEAVIGLGTFYAGLGRFADEGKLYEEAALRERTLARRPSFLLEGGQAYARAGDGEKAEELLRQAVASAPQNAEAYRYLTILVFAPRNDLESAKTIIAAGIQNGADPFSLLLA